MTQHLRTVRLELHPLEPAHLGWVTNSSADPRVMNDLGGVLSARDAEAWLARQVAHWREHGYGRYLVQLGKQPIGLVGLSRTDFERGIVPGVEVAWRLVFSHWGRGYATEAARAVMDHGFRSLGLPELIAVTAVGNLRSRRVMERLGMLHSPQDSFDHPKLPESDPLRRHVVYRAIKP